MVTTPSPFYPPPPVSENNREVAPGFDLLKAMSPIGRTAMDKPSLPPPMARAPHHPVVFGTALEKFIGWVHNIDLGPTVALEDITKTNFIIHPIRLRCQRFRDCW